MREAAVMGKSKDRAFEAVEHVQIGRLRGQSHSRGRKGRLAVESRSRQTRTGQEMCDGLQVDFVTQTVPVAPGALVRVWGRRGRPPYMDCESNTGWFLGTSTVSAS